MIDIHAHILPGIDDGAEDMYDTLEMARMAADSGVDKIIATPHCNIPGMYGNYFGKEYIDRYESVVRAVRKEKIPIEILPGMEVFSTEDLPELIVNHKIMPLNQSRYILMEFAFDEDPEFADSILKRVEEVGARPVIAHAERYEFIQDYPQIAYRWFRKGYVIQANKGSFLGSKFKDGDRVIMIEDVTTSGKSMEETVPKVKQAADVEIVGLIVSLNRMEVGKGGEKCALDEVKDLYGFDTAAIVTMEEVVEHLYNKPYNGKVVIDDTLKAAIDTYYETYGVK